MKYAKMLRIVPFFMWVKYHFRPMFPFNKNNFHEKDYSNEMLHCYIYSGTWGNTMCITMFWGVISHIYEHLERI